MTDVVKKIAEEKGLDLVVDVTTTLFFKPTLEITDDCIAAYDKAYPVK
jgi:outer membrane protein